jgi:hypothetical protein
MKELDPMTEFAIGYLARFLDDVAQTDAVRVVDGETLRRLCAKHVCKLACDIESIVKEANRMWAAAVYEERSRFLALMRRSSNN